jgi:hypothetical protein
MISSFYPLLQHDILFRTRKLQQFTTLPDTAGESKLIKSEPHICASSSVGKVLFREERLLVTEKNFINYPKIQGNSL